MKKILLTVVSLFGTFAATREAHAEGLKGDAVARGTKNALCTGCHGIKGYHIGFTVVHQVPKIFGQGAGCIRAALHECQVGERKHRPMCTLTASWRSCENNDKP